MANRSQISKLPVVTEPMPKVDDLNCLPETIQKVKHDTLEILERSFTYTKIGRTTKNPRFSPPSSFQPWGTTGPTNLVAAMAPSWPPQHPPAANPSHVERDPGSIGA